MKILRINIIQGHGADHVYLWADLPGTSLLDENLSLRFVAPSGTGPEYCQKHFPDVKTNVVKQR